MISIGDVAMAATSNECSNGHNGKSLFEVKWIWLFSEREIDIHEIYHTF